MRRLRRFAGLGVQDQLLLLEAASLSGIVRVAMLTLHFRRLARWMGRHHQETPTEPDFAAEGTALRVKWAVNIVGKHVPWNTECLVRALTARSMLQRRGVSGTIYFGLKKGADGELMAHAWLRSGERMITGGRGNRVFTVVSSFAFGGQPTVLRKEDH